MPIQMVGGHIQHDRDLRSKLLDGLQLKARDLQHNKGIRGSRLNQRYRGGSNVATNHSWIAATRDDLSYQSSGRSFAVRTRNRHNRAWEKTIGEFDLSDYRLAHRTRLYYCGRIRGDSTTHSNHGLSAQRSLTLAAGCNHDAMIEKLWNGSAQLVGRFGV